MLPPLSHSLSIVSAGDHVPFHLASRCCTLRGCEDTGIREVELAGRCIPGECRVTDGTCTRFSITPLGVERTLRVGSASVVERIVVSPAEPAFALEWSADSEVELTLALRDLASNAKVEAIGLDDFSRIRLSPSRPQLLIVSAAADPVNPDVWVRTHQAAAARRDAELVCADLPVPALGDAIRWALFRLSSSATRSGHERRALAAAGDHNRGVTPGEDAKVDEWPDFTAGQTSAAAQRWQSLALSCFEGERGAWRDEPGRAAADVIIGFVHGMLGLKADVERERVQLRPQFPLEFERARVSNLRVADASIELDFGGSRQDGASRSLKRRAPIPCASFLSRRCLHCQPES